MLYVARLDSSLKKLLYTEITNVLTYTPRPNIPRDDIKRGQAFEKVKVLKEPQNIWTVSCQLLKSELLKNNLLKKIKNFFDPRRKCLASSFEQRSISLSEENSQKVNSFLSIFKLS